MELSLPGVKLPRVELLLLGAKVLRSEKSIILSVPFPLL